MSDTVSISAETADNIVKSLGFNHVNSVWANLSVRSPFVKDVDCLIDIETDSYKATVRIGKTKMPLTLYKCATCKFTEKDIVSYNSVVDVISCLSPSDYENTESLIMYALIECEVMNGGKKERRTVRL